LYHKVRQEPLSLTVVERGGLESADNRDVICRVRAGNKASSLCIRWVIEDGTLVKQGQPLVEIEDTPLQDQLKTQKIALDTARANMVQAQENEKIVQSQGFSDITTARVSVELAEIDRKKYLEGDYLKEKMGYDSNIKLAQSDRDLQLDRVAYTERMVKLKYLGSTQLQAEQAKLQSLEVTLSKANEEMRVLEDYTKGRMIKDLTNKVEENKRTLDRTEKQTHAREAQAEAETARAKAVSAEEKVFSARETEVAERRKAIELIQASQDAERDALRIKIGAQAERLAAVDRADAQRTNAESEAESEKIRALASRLRYEIEAEGTRLMNEAQNMLTPESRTSNMRMRLLDKLEGIIRESVRPMEKIDSIKILHVDGLGGGNSRPGPEGGGNFADSMVNSALRYRAQAPLVDSLLKEMGLTGTDLTKLGNMMREPVGADGDDELK
jgi:uncharacterized membrane protein YqiK